MTVYTHATDKSIGISIFFIVKSRKDRGILLLLIELVQVCSNSSLDLLLLFQDLLASHALNVDVVDIVDSVPLLQSLLNVR